MLDLYSISKHNGAALFLHSCLYQISISLLKYEETDENSENEFIFNYNVISLTASFSGSFCGVTFG